MPYAITFDAICGAADRIRPWIHRTPVMTCATLDRIAGRRLFFKCEQFQKVGAFKFRGAMNAVLQLTSDEAERGVITHSSGNHAQGLALAAKLRGIVATIVMPRNAPDVKKNAVRDYGARLVECEPTLPAREKTVAEIQAETGATLVPPYNHPHVMAGQGTATLELLADVPDLDAIITPVGGGGLLSGTCIAGKGINPALRVFAAEPTGADDAYRSKTSGSWVPQTHPKTVADGLLTSLGDLTWPILRDVAEAVIPVTDAEIVAAMRLLWERAKLLVEPSAAVPLAAVLSPRLGEMGRIDRIGIILSGGNVNLDQLPW